MLPHMSCEAHQRPGNAECWYNVTLGCCICVDYCMCAILHPWFSLLVLSGRHLAQSQPSAEMRCPVGASKILSDARMRWYRPATRPPDVHVSVCSITSLSMLGGRMPGADR